MMCLPLVHRELPGSLLAAHVQRCYKVCASKLAG